MGLEKTSAIHEETISLLDILLILVKRRRLILGFTVLVAAVSFGLLYYSSKAPANFWNPLPNFFMPTVKVLISEGRESSSLSSILNQGNMTALTGLLGAGTVGTSGTSNADLAQSLLKTGVSVKDQIGLEFDFISRYKIEKNPKTATRALISNALDIKFDPKSGILEVGYKEKDPVFAANVVNRLVELLEEQFKNLTLEKVIGKKEYLEQTIVAADKESTETSQALVAFQNKYGFLDLPSQVSVSVQQIAQLQGRVLTQQVQLAVLQKSFPDSDARIVTLKNEIAELNKVMSEIKQGSDQYSTGGLATKQLVDLSTRYAMLKRDAEIAQSVLSTLKSQYEMTKLQEMDNSKTFQVVEKAEVPELKAGPSRTKIMIILTLSAFFISLLIAFIREYLDRARYDPIESEKLNAIRRMIGPRRGRPRE